MKIQIVKKLLNNATTKIQASLSDKKFSHIALKTADNRLILAANDWGMSVYHYIDCEVADQGEGFVPSTLFTNVVKELPEGLIQLERSESVLMVTSGDSFSFKLPLLDGSWEEPYVVDQQQELVFDPTEFGYLLDQIIPSVRTDAQRAYGTVGYFHKTSEGRLRLVGTDGCKLSYCEIEVKEGSPVPNKVCLEKRGLLELSKVCNDNPEKISVAVIKNKTLFAATTSNRQIFIKLSEVDFPDYLNAMPRKMRHRATIDRHKLQGAVKRVMLATDASHTLRLSFATEELEVSASNDKSSESRERFAIESSLKEAVKLDLNGKYILEFLGTITSDNISANFENIDRPIVVEPDIEVPCCKSQHVLLPIKESH